MQWYKQVRDSLYSHLSPFSTDWFSTLKEFKQPDRTVAPQSSYRFSFKEALYVEMPSPHPTVADTWDASVKVDYDTARNPIRVRDWKNTAEYLKKHGYTVTRAFVGRSRKGWHLRLWLDPVIGGATYNGCYTVLKLQEMLGDDPIRQRFNRGRVRRKRPGWSILFTHKFHNCELTSCEVYNPEWTKKAQAIFQEWR